MAPNLARDRSCAPRQAFDALEWAAQIPMATKHSSPQAHPAGTAVREAKTRRRARPQVTLLRHGEPDWAPDQGPSVNDPHLTPFGHAQAKAAAITLQHERFDAIYVSPYLRSQETAVPLAHSTGLSPITIEGLAEISVDATGLSQEEVDRYFVEAAERPLDEHWNGWPGAETFHAFHARVTKALEMILARHDITPKHHGDFTVWDAGDAAPHIAIVAHCGTNAVALTHLLDIPPVPWEWLRLESGLTGYSQVQARPVGPDGLVWSLQAFSRVDHLERAGISNV